MSGALCISLDFELHWGGFEKWPLQISRQLAVPIAIGSSWQAKVTRNLSQTEAAGFSGAPIGKGDYRNYFLNTRNAIPEMLQMFSLYQAHVTWATVGMLFHQSKTELLNNAPTQKPTYDEKQLSAYNFIENGGIGENEEEDPFHFAPSLIKQIMLTPNQEIATHTFAHYYCNELGQNVEQFRDDLRAAQRVAKGYGVTLRSLVFPRNQFNDQYLKVCFEESITSVRSNPIDWFWNIESTQSESAWKRLNRGLDAYFPIGKKNTYSINSLQVREGFPVCIPASRLLRPYNPKEFFLNEFKIQRIKSEMTRAAKNNEVYHLWWHPHNFGTYPNQSIIGLKKILDHYKYCHQRWGMQSLNMAELTSLIGHDK